MVWLLVLFIGTGQAIAQHSLTDSLLRMHRDSASTRPDTSLRIVNLNTNFTQHIDSSFVYQFKINKDPKNYYWYLKDAPVGLTINRENGVVSFRAAKNYFLSGRLNYDVPYTVSFGVQSLKNEKERKDTSFSILFYNTEIVPSTLKPSVSGDLQVDEGESISFRLQCENGSFPIENIVFTSSIPIRDYTPVMHCNDEFRWRPDFDFVKDGDSAGVKILRLQFTGTNRYNLSDTATVRIIVHNAQNLNLARESYNQVYRNVSTYVLQLKYAFLQLDKKLKKTKNLRAGFDLTTATSALTGTILNTSDNAETRRTAQILPSVGVALVPIKEATAPNQGVEQNQAGLVRSSIKRLEYMLQDNVLVGEKDPDLARKTQKLRDELKQVQVQLIDVPVDISNDMTEEDLNRYFNSKKVNKKYRLK
jgi:hypothetical protein